MLEFKWAHWLEQKKNELKGETWVFDDVVMVFIDDNLIGSTVQFIQWAIVNYNFEDFRNDDLYETLRREAYAGLLESTKVSCEWTYFLEKKISQIYSNINLIKVQDSSETEFSEIENDKELIKEKKLIEAVITEENSYVEINQPKVKNIKNLLNGKTFTDSLHQKATPVSLKKLLFSDNKYLVI